MACAYDNMTTTNHTFISPLNEEYGQSKNIYNRYVLCSNFLKMLCIMGQSSYSMWFCHHQGSN